MAMELKRALVLDSQAPQIMVVVVVARTPERGGCWLAQTPQVFHRGLYAEALAKAEADGFRGTDDAELVERLGAQVRVVSGNPSNFKITSPEDLVAAERGFAQGDAQ